LELELRQVVVLQAIHAHGEDLKEGRLHGGGGIHNVRRPALDTESLGSCQLANVRTAEIVNICRKGYIEMGKHGL
jgi:hypothetical protein